MSFQFVPTLIWASFSIGQASNWQSKVNEEEKEIQRGADLSYMVE
jgi:hypothetical protein